MKSRNLRIGHLPDKSKGEARHFLIELEQLPPIDRLVEDQFCANGDFWQARQIQQ